MNASSSGKRRMVTGLFDDTEHVERAYQACVQRGYEIGDVNVVMSDDTRQRYLAKDRKIDTELAEKKAEGGELGGPTGGRMGLAISVVAAVGAALAIPALGLVMAGPLAVALAGAGAAGLAAGLMGAFHDWGLPEDLVRRYEGAVHDGSVMIGVETRTEEDARQIQEEWKALGGREIYRS